MILLPILAALAPEPPNPTWNCDEPIVQQEMNWCAQQEYLAADALLNEQWEATARTMKQRDMIYETHDERPGYFDQLLAAQRAWLTFRDEHCATEGYVARGGTLEPLLVSTCKTSLTEERTQQLHDLEVWPE